LKEKTSIHTNFIFFNYTVTVRLSVRIRKREPEELVGLPGFAGGANKDELV